MKLVLVDDHTLFREGMLHVLRQLDEGALIFEASCCADAFSLVDQHSDIDLILLDLGLPDMGGMHGLEILRERAPMLPVVMLSATYDRNTVQTALDNGASGFIPKSSTSQIMIGALKLVLSGGVYLPPLLLQPGETLAKKSGQYFQDTQALTERQREVLMLLAEGKPNKVIARALNLTEGTVKIHLAAIFKVLHVTNRTEALLAAQKLKRLN